MNAHILRPLAEKSFSYLWFGEIFTQIAINTLNFFLILLVYEMTRSSTAVSGVIVTFIIPAIILGSFAGVYVDRWNKRKVLIFTNLVRALLLLVLAFTVSNLVLLYILSLLIAVITQFFIPAEIPMIPLTVRKENLLSANALFGMAFSGSVVIAYLLAAPLLALFGSFCSFIVLAGMFGLGGFCILFVKMGKEKIHSPQLLNKRPHIFQEIRHAFTVFTQKKIISRAMALLALSQVLTLTLAAVAPGYASQVLNISLTNFSLYFAAPAAVGMVVGGALLVNVFHTVRRKYVVFIGILLSGICLTLLPLGSEASSRVLIEQINHFLPTVFDINILRTVVFLIFLIGIGNALVFVSANTVIQEQTADSLRGKLYGFLNTIVGIFSLAPVILVGGLSDLIGVGSVMTGIGFSLIFLAIYMVLIQR